MTPLHVACLAHEPPPLWMTRGLLYTAPAACRQTDNGGRLPLHLLVATSADVGTMRLLVEEFPPSVAHKDDRGFTPLQLLLKNEQVSLTLEHLRLLLGQIDYFSKGAKAAETERRHNHFLFRRGDHLTSGIEELEGLGKQREERHESSFRQYPDDVRQCLTKITQWKRRDTNRQSQKNKRQRQEELEFLECRDRDFTNPASIPTPTGQLLPLHLLVRRRVKSVPSKVLFSTKEATLADLLRVLIAAYPQGLVGTDANGKTPIMAALLQKDALPDEDSIELLMGMRTPGYDKWNRERPASIPSGDTYQLPLHVAAEELLWNYSILSAICEANPDARTVQDIRGRTPLHLALQNYRSIPVDEATLSLLYVDAVAKIKDHDGKTPFDLMVENPKCVEEPHRSKHYVKPDSVVFQDFLDASIERPRNGQEAQSFLQRFRGLPPWLRREACAARFVQETLLEEIVSPFNTFRIISSGFVLVVLLALLRRLLHVNDDLAVLIYYLATYHLTVQVIYWATTLYMGECFRLCVTNPWRWIDVITCLLGMWCAHAVSSSAGMGSSGGIDDPLVSTLGASATAACWLSLLGYMVDWWCGVAVFVGSALQLLYILVWPLCVGAMGIIATSQVIFTLEDCSGGGICSLSDAYTVVYWMILGEPVLSDGYDFSGSMVVTIIAFTVLWIWWIFSAVAMTVAEANRLDRSQLALKWYWEPKVTLTVMVASDDAKLSDSPSLVEQYCDRMEQGWDVLSSALRGETSSEHWSACCFRSKFAGVFTGFIALFLLPIWFGFGLVTFGLLWPPQVRRWLFRPTDTCPSINQRRPRFSSNEDYLTRAKLSQLRADVVDLKAVAYDQNYQIQKDLGFLKDVIYRAVMEDDWDQKKME